MITGFETLQAGFRRLENISEKERWHDVVLDEQVKQGIVNGEVVTLLTFLLEMAVTLVKKGQLDAGVLDIETLKTELNKAIVSAEEELKK